MLKSDLALSILKSTSSYSGLKTFSN